MTRSHQRFLFAQAKDQWGRRPDSFVGGGLGMKVYEHTMGHKDATQKEKRT